MNIYILEVETNDDWFYMPFSTAEKAAEFIINNFEQDKPKKVTNELYEGKNNKYVIREQMIDQVRL